MAEWGALAVRSVDRARLPGDGSVEGWLAVTAAQATGLSMVVLRERTIDLIQAAGAPPPLGAPMFLAGLTTTATEVGGAAVAVGWVGRADVRSREGALPVALAFLEWSDCAWWMWEALVDAEGAARGDTARERSAADGDALPGGLGRAWSLARRSGVRLRLDPRAPVVH